jgi:hypothetical protein
LTTRPFDPLEQFPPFVRNCTVNPVDEVLPTTAKQLLLEYRLPLRSRTLIVTVTFVPAGKASLKLTLAVEEPGAMVAVPARYALIASAPGGP